MENKIFKIIGIQILEDTESFVRKSLHPGWYPFIKCDNNIGISPDAFPQVSSYGVPDDYFRIDHSLPHVTVSAIVGKNGAGKSTLLEILYRIINNFSIWVLDFDKIPDGGEIPFAPGMNVRLFFQLGDLLIEIHCNKMDTSLSTYDAKTNTTMRYDPDNALYFQEGNIDILKKLFYTISVNYSLYAFNPMDAIPQTTNDCRVHDNLTWVERMFHRNDGYLTPLVLTPFRHEGTININNETQLALQRLSVISVLFHSQSKDFIPGYDTTKLWYQFKNTYKADKLASLGMRVAKDNFPKIDINQSITILEQIWQSKLEELLHEKDIDFSLPSNQMTIFYLAYKTLKIYQTYTSFSKKIDFINLFVNCDTSLPTKFIDENKESINKAIDYIIAEKSHITAKVHQCLYFIQHENYKNESGEIDVDTLLAGRKYESYDEVLKLLPPPFYKIDLGFRKRESEAGNSENDKNLLSFQTMSSGERQLLYSLSYVLYHIKNLSSVNEKSNTIKYRNLNLVLDEAELYYHPDFQRIYIKRLLENLACFNLKKDIDSIHIIIVTHSPFLLSDIPASNILFLGSKQQDQKTFGANIYDLLKSSFFMDYAIGDFAKHKIEDIMKLYREKDNETRKEQFLQNKIEMEYTVHTIADEYLHKVLSKIYNDMDLEYCASNNADILNKIKQKEEEIKQLKRSLKHEKD